jgi:hypothetical protein
MTGPRPRGKREENALLFRVASVTPETPGQWDDLDQLDWEYVLAAADRQGITPLLAHRLREGGCVIPPVVAERLAAAYWTNHFRNRTLLDALHRILAAAAEAGIAVMPLKGAALVTWYYPAPALRPMSDLDLLIRPDDIAPMARLLEAQGYTAVPRPPSLFDERDEDHATREYAFVTDAAGMRVLIEYRAEPLDPSIGSLLKADPASDARFRAHCERMWERGHHATIGDGACMRISPEDLLLHVASHLTTRHAGLRLLWLHDLRLIAAMHRDTFDWDYLIAEARRLRLAAPIHAALDAARRWLDAPIPREQLARLSGGVARGSLRQAYERRLFVAQVVALGQSDLSAAGASLQWRPLAISMGRLHAGRAPWRAVGRVIAPSGAYMSWWHGASIESGRAYWRAVAFRIAYVMLNVATAIAVRLRMHRFARLLDRRVGRMQPHTPYGDHHR